MNQVTAPSLHIPLIIFEGIPMTISLLRIPSRLKELQLPQLFSIQNLFNTTASMICISCVTLVVLIFDMIHLLSNKIKLNLVNGFISAALKHFIVFCDLIPFRYFSSLVIIMYSNLIFKCLTDKLSIGFLCFSCLSLLIYVTTIYYHIHKTYIIFHVDCKEIIKQKILYPFDEYSRRLELYMLRVKIVEGFEYIISEVFSADSTTKGVTPHHLAYYSPYFFRYWFIILIIFSQIKFIIYDLFVMKRSDAFLINTKFNLTRIGLVVFYMYILILMMLGINDSVNLNVISSSVILLLSFLWTIVSVMLIWNKVILPQLYNGQISIKKFSFVITRSESTEKKKEIPFLYIDPIKVLNSFKINHFVHCLSNKPCNLCSLFYEEYTDTISYLNFYLKLLKHEVIEQTEDSDCFLSAILTLLFFRFNSKPYKYYRHYQKKTIEMENNNKKELFVNYINLLFSSFININNDRNNVSLYNQITSLASLNTMIRSILESERVFINLDEEHDKFEGIVKLSAEIVALDQEAQLVYKTTGNQAEDNANEQITKKIKNVYQYNIMLNKYIIEKVLNKPLNSSLPVEPDQLKDSFTSHYDNDNFLMLSLNNPSFVKEAMISDIIILKSGHSLIHFESKSFQTIIPSQLQSEANKLFITLLKDYNAEKESNQSFDFIISDDLNGTVSSFKYQFDLLHLLSNDSLLIYGFYTHPEKNIMLFESAQFDPNDLSLWRYSESIQSLLFISIKIIDIAKEMNFFFNLNELFPSIKELDNDLNANDNDSSIECLFNYNEYHKLLQMLLIQFNMFYSSNNNRIREEITNAIRKSKVQGNKQIRLALKLLFNYTTIKAYSVNALLSNSDSTNPLSKKNSGLKMRDSSQMIDLNNNISTSSFADNHSMKSIASRITNRKEVQLQLMTLYNASSKDILNDSIVKLRSRLTMKIVIGLNVFIIALCVLLLLVQIIQLKSLFSLNDLYLQFKNIRITFTHALVNIYSNVCLGDENSDTCTNSYIDYSKRILDKSIDSSLIGNDKFLVSNYINGEIKYKLNRLMDLFNQNKDALFSKGDQDLIDILSQKMNYSHIIYCDNRLSIDTTVYTLEQGLKNSFNSMQIIQSHPGYISENKLFILLYNGSSFDFSNVKPQKLDQVQTELYRLSINFLNFFHVFIKGEDKLLNKIQRIKKLNRFILTVSIGTIFTFNFILFILCLYEFKLTHQLLMGFCIEIVTLLLNDKVRKFFNSRIDNLLLLNKLYEKNPNSLIRDITNNEQIQMKRSKKLLQTTRTASLSLSSQSNNDGITDSAKHKRSSSDFPEKSSEDSIQSLIKPYEKISSYIFYHFFIIFIIFAYIVYTTYSKVLDIAEYVQLNYIFENNIYTSMGITLMMSLLSITDKEIATAFGYDFNSLNESILNIQNREISYYLDLINSLEANDPTTFPSSSSFFPKSSDCQSIMIQINDLNSNLVSAEKGVNYNKLSTEMCKRFNSVTLPKFEYMYNDLILKIESLQTILINAPPSQLVGFNKLGEVSDLYTIGLMLFRPIRFYIKFTLLTSRIAKKMNDFIVLVAVFLSLNGLFTVSIFVINKWYVFSRLNLFNESLCSLKKSLLM